MHDAFDEFEDQLAALQALRASPPGLAAPGSGQRRKVFSASLQQLGELMQASQRVGLATAPLTLFYALSQGGRAIAAARLRGPGNRYAFQGHGARVAHGATVGETRVVPEQKTERTDALSVLAEACGSSIPSAPPTFADLWASLPLLPRAPGLGDGAPAALEVRPLATNPEHPNYNSAYVTIPEPPEHKRDWTGWPAEQLAMYPATAGAHISPSGSDAAGRRISLTWLDENGVRRMPAKVCENVLGRLYLRPRVSEGDPSVHVLLTWWLLLLALSYEARYRPAQWTATIDLDRSPAAVPLARGLRLAVSIIPGLVREAITAPVPSKPHE